MLSIVLACISYIVNAITKDMTNGVNISSPSHESSKSSQVTIGVTTTNSPTECGLCQRLWVNPVTLPCLDTFCLTCIEQRLVNNDIICPACSTLHHLSSGENLDSLPYNTFSRKVAELERISSQDVSDRYCDACSRVKSVPSTVNI